jgi:hypothetical protein
VAVVRGVITDEVDDRRPRPARVVEVRGAVTEAAAEVQQRDRRPSGHAPVALRCASHDPFEQREHGSHLRDCVELSDEVHIGGPRVAKHTSTPEAVSVRIKACAPFIPAIRPCAATTSLPLSLLGVEPSLLFCSGTTVFIENLLIVVGHGRRR